MKHFFSTVFLIFSAFFFCGTLAADTLDKFEPKRHISLEEQGKIADGFLDRTFRKMRSSYDAMRKNYAIAWDLFQSASGKTADHLKDASSDALRKTGETVIDSSKKKARELWK